MLIYSLLFFCNLLINVDHGTIPASTLHLKTDLGIDNVALGFLGSLVFLGLTFGTSFIFVLIVFYRVTNGNAYLQLFPNKVHTSIKLCAKQPCSVNFYSDFRVLPIITFQISRWLLSGKNFI